MALPDQLPASAAAIEVQETFYRNKGLTFKTQAKRKYQDDNGEDLPDLLDLSPYSTFFKPDEETPIMEIDHIAGVLVRLDEGIGSNNAALLQLVEDYRSEHTKAGDAITALWLRIGDPAHGHGLQARRVQHVD